MKPDWDKLIEEFNSSTDAGLVADVDCTAAGKPLCEKVGVKGYPTIKWGDPNSLEDYKGGRDYDTLLKFAQENLKPICSPGNLDLCDDDKKAEIEKFQALVGDELDKLISDKEKEQADAEAAFKKRVEKLQKKYEKAQKKKEAAVEAVKNSGLGLMKSVKAHAAKSSAEKSEL